MRMESGSHLPPRPTPPLSLKAKLFRSAYQIRPHMRRCDRQKRLRAKIRNPVRLAGYSVFSSMGDKRNSAGGHFFRFVSELRGASGRRASGVTLLMTITRRSFVLFSLCAAAQTASSQQGVASREVKPQAAPAPSQRPFPARLADVAEAAGLDSPVIYGGVERKKYILEANGCGCAFIDYDNDGWMDIFLLSGTRLDGDPPEATNRLYKNNRDGTFTDVTEKAGLKAAGWASGVSRRRLQQRRLRRHLHAPTSDRTCSIATTEMEHSPM